MRKLRMTVMALVLILTLAVCANAATGASSAQSFATVSSDGSCQVNMALTLHLEQAVSKLYFPIPRQATAVSVNGSRVSAPKSGDTRRVNLSKYIGNLVGDFSVNIQYSLHDVIHVTEAGTLEMQVPLLNGFAYTIDTMTFSVTLPGAVEAKPAFISGYHQAGIEEDLSCTVDGMTISGSSLKALKDHETLTMKLAVTEEMFPRTLVQTQNTDSAVIGMAVCAGLALLYWLLALRNLPWGWQRVSEPPEGFSAGVLGCVSAMQGVDLSMLILNWAQLGYVLIQVDRRNRVLLHKRMEMGNERSEFERRYFKKIFGKRNLVDTSSYGYAQLNRSAAKCPAGIQEMIHPRSGNSKVFRALASGIGLFGGAGIGLVMGSGAVLQGLLVILMAAAGAASGWFIQDWAGNWGLRKRDKLITGLALSIVWLLLSLAVGEFVLGLRMVLGLMAAGLLLRWSGRRTQLGRQTAAHIRGLRWYLLRADREHLRQRCDTDPDYFFRMMPYAMALGVDKAFARGFGGRKLSGCPYLTSGMDAHMTALQWSEVMRQAVAAMDERANRLPLEKLLGMLHSITRG